MAKNSKTAPPFALDPAAVWAKYRRSAEHVFGDSGAYGADYTYPPNPSCQVDPSHPVVGPKDVMGISHAYCKVCHRLFVLGDLGRGLSKKQLAEYRVQAEVAAEAPLPTDTD